MTINYEDKQIPVLLVTGYLGSGKTTLLNRILTNKKGIKFAVIVNDLGEVNIDAELIQKGGVVGTGDDSLVALQNGCICCTLKMDLISQLADLCRIDKFDYIVIEASGICEPGPIAQTISSFPQIGPKQRITPRLDCIVTVVDALRMQSEFACGDALTREDIGDEDLERLVIEQIEFCNLVLLNKASSVKPEELARVRQIVKALNPGAEILECDYGDVDLDKLVNTNRFDFEKVATSAAWISEIEGHEDDDEGEAEEYNIGTYVYCARPAMDLNKFDYVIARHWPKNIIRAKGLCYFSTDIDKCYLYEQAGVQKTLREAGLWYAAMPKDRLAELLLQDAALQRDWDPAYGDRMQKIVFIGQNLDKALIKELMDSCLVE